MRGFLFSWVYNKNSWHIYFDNYMFKVENRNTRKRCELCSKLTIKTPEWWIPTKNKWSSQKLSFTCSGAPFSKFYVLFLRPLWFYSYPGDCRMCRKAVYLNRKSTAALKKLKQSKQISVPLTYQMLPQEMQLTCKEIKEGQPGLKVK